MPNRALLAIDKIEDFAAWAASIGWTREDSRQDEILRMRHLDVTHPFLAYRRNLAKEHATIPLDPTGSRWREDLVRRWVRERKP
jgi:hypothetical protein